MTASGAPVIYPAQRAIEHAVSVSGVRPLRYFGLLWPLWQVEITGTVDDPQAYEVLDRFIERAIGEARLGTAAHIADFLGLAPPLVGECLRYLTTIHHVEERSGILALTQRGQASLQAGKRYVAKETRQLLLFDQFTRRPLPRSHYADNITVVNRPWLEGTETVDRTPFTALFAGTEYRADLVHQLAASPNRSEYNLPNQVADIQIIKTTTVYLPAYLVQTTGDPLAYTRAGEERDAFVEDACRRTPTIAEQLARESFDDPRTLWVNWAAGHRGGLDSLHQLPNGVWRCTLPATPMARSPNCRCGDWARSRYASSTSFNSGVAIPGCGAKPCWTELPAWSAAVASLAARHSPPRYRCYPPSLG
jgi:hypothetical protein